LALSITALALIGFDGDVRAVVARPEPVTLSNDLPVRANIASRALLRTELSIAAATVTEPAAPIDPPAAVEREPEPVVEDAPRPALYVPPTCAANQFCYPRVGIVGTIVPYSDCSGRTDVGTAIRSLTCVSRTYLAAHAYTQFGRIAGWRAGDVVFAYGARYVVFDAFTQQGCVPPARALAPLSLQTSLTPATCGPILVVQARLG
jgi:hypothetical protein